MPPALRSRGSSNAAGHGRYSNRNNGDRGRGRGGGNGTNGERVIGSISSADAGQSDGDERKSAGATEGGDGKASSSRGRRSNQRGTATSTGKAGSIDESNAGTSTEHRGKGTRKGRKQKRGAGGNANHLLQFQYEPRSDNHFSEVGDDEGTGRSRRGGGGGARKNSGVWGGGSSRGPMSKEQFLQASG